MTLPAIKDRFTTFIQMRKIKIMLWLLAAPLLVSGQYSMPPVSLTQASFDEFFFGGEIPKIEGRVYNATAEELADISLSFHVVNLTGTFQTRLDADIRPDGTFSLEMDSRLPYRQVWVRIPDLLSTCLYVNDGIFIDLDLALLKKKDVYLDGVGLVFKGPDAEVCRVVNQHLLFGKKHATGVEEKLSDLKRGIGDPALLDSLFEIKRQTDSIFFEENGSRFRFLIDNNRRSAYFESKMTLLNRRLFESKGKDKIPVDWEELWAHPIYTLTNESRAFLMYLYHRYLFDNKDENVLMNDFDKLAPGISAIYPGSYSDLVSLQIESKDVKEQRTAYEVIGPRLQNRWARSLAESKVGYLAGLEEQIDRVIASATGDRGGDLGELKLDTPFHARLIVSDKTSGKDLLESIMRKYTKKLVLIDIWATWCAPCIEEMPYSKKLHDEARRENLPVEFVYLCTSSGSKEERWTRKVVELSQPGTHIFVEDKHIAELFSLFNKSGYPSYLVIRPDGTIDTQGISRMSHLTMEALKAML